MYITLKQCGESLPLVVMATTTFIHYMVVMYIYNYVYIYNLYIYIYIYTSSEWHCHFTQLVKSVMCKAKYGYRFL